MIMDIRAYVIHSLEQYNAMQQEIKTLQYELSILEQLREEDTIEAMSYFSSQGEWVDNNKVANKTADIALSYTQKFQEDKKQLVSNMKSRTQDLIILVNRLDFYLESLEAFQAAVLRGYYIEGYSWRELQDLRGVTSKTLMKQRDRAIRALILKYSQLDQIGLL